MRSIAPADLARRLESPNAPALLDVRTRQEFDAGHVPGAVNVPFNEIGTRIEDVPASVDEELVVYCGHGPRAWIAAHALGRRGYRNVTLLKGHWAVWRRLRMPVHVSPKV